MILKFACVFIAIHLAVAKPQVRQNSNSNSICIANNHRTVYLKWSVRSSISEMMMKAVFIHQFETMSFIFPLSYSVEIVARLLPVLWYTLDRIKSVVDGSRTESIREQTPFKKLSQNGYETRHTGTV